MATAGTDPVDGGFTILLYENAVLSFSTYDARGIFLDELCFSLPARTISCFYALIRNAASWLSSTPSDLRSQAETPALYGSSFAFDGYEPFRVYGMNELLCEPTGSAGGFFARHLYVLFEDICNLFADSGVNLSLDGFTWRSEQIRPFRRQQLYGSAPQQGVI